MSEQNILVQEVCKGQLKRSTYTRLFTNTHATMGCKKAPKVKQVDFLMIVIQKYRFWDSVHFWDLLNDLNNPKP